MPVCVAGLIGSGERKSIQPMAARAEGGSYGLQHHAIAAGICQSAPPERVIVSLADRLAGGPDAILVVGVTALPERDDAWPAWRCTTPPRWPSPPTA
ncbi:transposase [Methylobacterium sp. P5_C11]